MAWVSVDGGSGIFPEMPEIHLDPTERRAVWLIVAAAAAAAVLVFFGPVPVAVPLMTWWTTFAAINEGRVT